MRRLILWTLLLLAASLGASRLVAETLKQALERNAVPTAGLDPAELAKKITSYAARNDPDRFCMATYVDDGSGNLPEHLDIYRLNKSGSQWLHRRLDLKALIPESPCAAPGSILDIKGSREFFALHTHLNPSAACTLLLTNDLDLHDALYGWLLTTFADDTMVYHESQVHFAPTHSAEISIYDARKRRSRRIYPTKPYQAARLEHIEKVRGAFARRGEKWFAEHNHPMDPERFSNFWTGDVALDERTRALAFRINYDNTETWSEAETLRGQTFPELREIIRARGTGLLPPGELFRSLDDDLDRVRQLQAQDAVVKGFEDEPELRRLLQKALESTRPEGVELEQHFAALDPAWKSPAVWEKLARSLPLSGEFTPVVCVYRNLSVEGPIDYREILLQDLVAQFGEHDLGEYLKPEILGRIFQK